MAAAGSSAKVGSAAEQGPQARLIALGVEQAREYPLGAGSTTLGSTPDNDIVLSDPGVSRHHARITRRGGRFRVTDLESTNGTYLNG
ncbi:MAG TPA: FHA domain-containing protein, partial [Candidatus Binataceae bacterium]|nr:FHA domain-containing protein [Candidatus Binataceae bacterium]